MTILNVHVPKEHIFKTCTTYIDRNLKKGNRKSAIALIGFNMPLSVTEYADKMPKRI